MDARVKRGVRSYDNSHRARQAEATQRRIMEAARRLFIRNGYPSTTIQAIADEAGVAVQTLYSRFGSKLEVLKQVFHASVRGEDQDTPLAAQPPWRAWLNERDPRKQVELFARANREVAERTADVVRIVATAAGADPAIEQMWEEWEERRYTDQKRLARSLARRRQLREGLSVRRSADITWALAGPGVYADLVGRRGWRRDEYEAWLSKQLAAALL